ILSLATVGGHHATGLSRTSVSAGTLAEGAPADVVVLPNDSMQFVDFERPAASLVLGSTARQARHVVAAGRVLLRDGILTSIDEFSLLQRLRRYQSTSH